MGLALSMAKAGSNRWMVTRLEKKPPTTMRRAGVRERSPAPGAGRHHHRRRPAGAWGRKCSRSHPLHHGAVRVQTGQPTARHLVFIVRKVLRGYFAVTAADGRGLGVQHLAPPRLGRHLGVAADDDVIGVAGRCILVYLRLLRTYTVADAGRSCAAHSLDGAAPDGDVAAGSLRSSADACAAFAAQR